MSLTLENLSREVDGVDYIRDANLTFEAGSFNVLLGRTLAGKTSLMRLMAGLDKPDNGRLIYNGEDVTGQSVQNRNISMIYQQFINYPNLTVYENIASPLRLAKMTESEIDRRVKETASMLRIDPLLKRYPLELSGGQQQRLALARALTREPGLLLLDEPLSNLDAQLREQMRSELKRLQRETGVTAIYVTHDQSEALAISDRIAVMSDGLIMQIGSPKDIYERPTSEFVANFIGTTNLLRGNLNADIKAGNEAMVDTPLGKLLCTFTADVLATPTVGVVIRPENIIIAKIGDDKAATLPDSNRCDGTLLTETYLGEIVEYEVGVGDETVLIRTKPTESLTPQDAVTLHFPTSQTLALIEKSN